MRQPLVSVVILNWNCRGFLGACIESVLAQAYPVIDLLLVDNASTDGSVQWLADTYPQLAVVVNDENVGFARAHNQAIRLTRGDYYLPLNPDVVLTPGFVGEMVAALEEHPEAGSATGKVYFSMRSGSSQDVRIYTTGHLLTKNRRPSNRGYKRKDTGQFDTPGYVFGANGACPLLRREMLDDVAFEGEFFDEMFFLYGDDYDLGWRAQLLGWRCLYVPTAVAYHHGKGSRGLYDPYIQYQYARNNYLVTYKNDLLGHFLADLPYILLYEVLWQAYILLTDPRRELSHARAIVDFLRLLPEARRRRRALQSRRRVTAKYMRSLFTGMVFR